MQDNGVKRPQPEGLWLEWKREGDWIDAHTDIGDMPMLLWAQISADDKWFWGVTLTLNGHALLRDGIRDTPEEAQLAAESALRQFLDSARAKLGPTAEARRVVELEAALERIVLHSTTVDDAHSVAADALAGVTPSFDAALARARKEERARIVAWLNWRARIEEKDARDVMDDAGPRDEKLARAGALHLAASKIGAGDAAELERIRGKVSP